MNAPRLVNDFTILPQAPKDILEAVEAAYEYAVWAADLGMVDFAPFAPLSRVIGELRAQVAPTADAEVDR